MHNYCPLLCSVRVSNELGSGHPRAAKFSVIVTCVESLLIGIICAAIILASRNYFSIIFTDSLEMRKAVADLAYLLGVTMLLNSVQPVISGMHINRPHVCPKKNTHVLLIIGMEFQQR